MENKREISTLFLQIVRINIRTLFTLGLFFTYHLEKVLPNSDLFSRIADEVQRQESDSLIEKIKSTFIIRYLEKIKNNEVQNWRNQLFWTGSCDLYPELGKFYLETLPSGGFSDDHIHDISCFLRRFLYGNEFMTAYNSIGFIMKVLVPECLEMLLEEMFSMSEDIVQSYLDNYSEIQAKGISLFVL